MANTRKGPARRLAVALAASASVAALIAIGPAAAHAADQPGKPGSSALADIPGPVPDGFASWQDLMKVQNRLDHAADRITAEAGKPGNQGLGSIVVDQASRDLRLYWKGALPSSVRGLLDQLRPTVPVQVLAARYSEDELQAKVRSIIAHPAVPGARITEAAPLADASGVEVSVDSSVDAGRQLPAVRNAGVPVTVRVARPRPHLDRWHDTRNYWGGAAWENTAGGLCSTGFAVSQGGTAKMLTAGHCAQNGDMAWTGTSHQPILSQLGESGGDQKFMGYVEQKNVTKDTELINAPSGGAQYASNPLHLNDSTNLPVTGWAHNYYGDYLFTNGALSGLRTNIQVIGVNVSVLYNGVYHLQNKAAAGSGEDASGSGDSGGPVVSIDDTGSGSFIARGIITAGDDTNAGAYCAGIQDSGRTCSWIVDFESIGDALATYNASLITG